MLHLYVLPGSATHDLPSLDPESLVAASYLQLLRPGEWELVECSDQGLSPSGSLPFLRLEDSVELAGSAILPHLIRSTKLKSQLNALQASESTAFQALLDTTVLPLVLHSLYSLPQNWTFTRQLLASSMSYPTKMWRPAQLRESARELVEATHPTWWGMGGEAEAEEEAQRRRKKALLETGIEGVRERKDEERRDGKDRVRKTFGEGKIAAAAREVFTALESTLAASSTPFFFSSSSPTPLDAHLSSLLSLVLYLPLPAPILADLINASFPRLWTHTALLRRTLWSEPPSRPSPSSAAASCNTWGWVRDLIPNPWEWESLAPLGLGRGNDVKRGGTARKPTKKEQEFARRRWQFAAVVGVGLLGWGLGTGAIPLPGKLGRVLAAGEEEGEWEEEEEDEEEIIIEL
ncbi:hypothetical protein BCR35DRAFT_355142 [Leucosporidium creatinivorum]|uniref:Mitochondrial outer membrane transport complex Sam37/metaxin N-terminal domain-containing protein n=1 Tax=Leucosporidium creatinivorum TaxID=106004 RepID=A0A1Y2DRJ9_9BASI|nr:hypothetical protein BCR35DRAFT_355142 [Leucosporidium creatinivorum]